MSNDKYRWCPKGDTRCEYCKQLGTAKGCACNYYKEKGLDDKYVNISNLRICPKTIERYG